MKPILRNTRPLRRTFFRQWREKAGLTQEQAAERLAVSLDRPNFDRSLLSKIESAKSPYTQRILEAAAEAYGCQPEDILIRDPSKESAIWSIHDNLKRATPEQIEQVETVTYALLRRRKA